jgi:AcrR family transcriptional regulator
MGDRMGVLQDEEAMVLADEDSVRVNKSGQSLGQKGHRTRQRILDATRQLIEAQKGLAPAAAAVAREAGISSPTFYLYFADVGEAILDVVAEISQEFEPVADLLEAPWPADQLFEYARQFTEAYFAYWYAHAAILRVRNRLADGGDERFKTLRMAQGTRLADPLTRKLAKGVFDGREVVGEMTLATILITALERTATVEALALYAPRSTDNDAIGALALLIARSIKGEAQ